MHRQNASSLQYFDKHTSIDSSPKGSLNLTTLFQTVIRTGIAVKKHSAFSYKAFSQDRLILTTIIGFFQYKILKQTLLQTKAVPM